MFYNYLRDNERAGGVPVVFGSEWLSVDGRFQVLTQDADFSG
jgi:hypothetical protein